jgi:hypothetical protein
VGAKAAVEILVDYPVSERDNDVIAQMMNTEVGKFIALGGHAYHLTDAVVRIREVMKDNAEHEVGRAMASLYDERRTSANPE